MPARSARNIQDRRARFLPKLPVQVIDFSSRRNIFDDLAPKIDSNPFEKRFEPIGVRRRVSVHVGLAKNAARRPVILRKLRIVQLRVSDSKSRRGLHKTSVPNKNSGPGYFHWERTFCA